MYRYSLFHQLSGTRIQRVVLFRVSHMSTLTSVNDTSRTIEVLQKYTFKFLIFYIFETNCYKKTRITFQGCLPQAQPLNDL